MYSIIGVDDEKECLVGVFDAVSWSEYGFEYKGVFENVKDVLEYLKTNQIDAIISDIKMPEMDGLEFAKIIHETYPNIKFILLSAYSDFEYARKGIEYNIFDYILKPIDETDIEKLLLKLKPEIKKIHDMNTNMYGFSKKQLVLDWMIGGIDKNCVSDYINNSNYDSKFFTKPVALIETKIINFEELRENNWKYGLDRLYLSIDNLLDLFCLNSVRYRVNSNIIGYMLFSDNDSSETFENEITGKIENIILFAKEFLKIEISINITQLENNLLLLNSNADNNSRNKYELKKTMEYIENKEYDAAKECIIRVFSAYKENDVILWLYTECILSRLARMHNIDLTEDSIKEMIPELQCKYLIDAIEKISEKYAFKSNIIEMAVKYIEENYRNDISLKDVAEYCNVAPQSLSRAFTRELNIKYIDYLVKIRIENAKRYLTETNIPINKIAKMCGFTDVKYLYRVFKKYVGCSTGDYRNNISQK